MVEREARNWLFDGLQEAVRVVRRQEPPRPYQPFDYSRSFPILESPRETLAWHENARDLIALRWRSHTFNVNKDWHPQASAWIGRNNKTHALAALLCVRDWPDQNELNQFALYVADLEASKGRRLELLVAVQNGSGSKTAISDSHEIKITTQNSLLDDLVDFSDYFLEIERRVSVDCLPDLHLTIEDVYVRPLAIKIGSGGSPLDLEDYLETWASESSYRQLG